MAAHLTGRGYETITKLFTVLSFCSEGKKGLYNGNHSQGLASYTSTYVLVSWP